MRAKGIIGLAAGLAAVAVAVVAFLPHSASPKNAALAARQEAMKKLGEQISRLRPGAKVLVLSNPFTKDASFLNKNGQFERAGLRGLRQGLGSGSPVTVDFPEIRPEYVAHPESAFIPPDSRAPLSFIMRPGCVDQLADAHPECAVIVSLIGLPPGVEEGKTWKQNDLRCFALLLPDLRVLGTPQKVVEAFQMGKILALVAEDAVSGGPLIVTRDNVQEVVERQPRALGF